MSDIFISYARKDLDKVRPLAEALENHGWSVWWDPKIRSGTPFDRVIEQALEKTRSVVVVWSKASVDSDWVRAEASYGLNKGFLISIAIERDVAVPIRFLNIQTEPLLDWDEKKPSFAFDKIVGDLEAVIGHPEAHEKPPDKGKVPPDLGAMVEVPAGEFIYQDGKATIEKPYMIDAYPVTNQQYGKFIKAGGYQNEQLWSKEGQAWQNEEKAIEPEFWQDDKLNQPKHPVVGVNYYEAEAFARWSDKRLPTEIEWERTARGTDGRQYPWGNEFDPGKCNTKEAAIERTTAVTRYSNGISPVSCYDMAGNVWEWSDSWFDDIKDFRVLRGGSWRDNWGFARYYFHPYRRDLSIGFRCVRTKK